MHFDNDRAGSGSVPPSRLPHLLTPSEVAGLLRTSKTAIYARIERGQLPGVVRVGRRVLVRESDLLEWLTPELPPSPER
jgi:excisionase family DNA binding protein